MPLKVKFHKDHLGGWGIVQPLIRPNEIPPVHQKHLTPSWQLYRIQLTQTEPKPSVICVFCQKPKHKFPIFCRKLHKMDPRHIFYIMRNHGIQCKMCFDTKHMTEDCKLIKNGTMKKCHIEVDGMKCNKYHNRFLHEY